MASQPHPHLDMAVRDPAGPPGCSKCNTHTDSPCLHPFCSQPHCSCSPSPVPTHETPRLHPSTPTHSISMGSADTHLGDPWTMLQVLCQRGHNWEYPILRPFDTTTVPLATIQEILRTLWFMSPSLQPASQNYQAHAVFQGDVLHTFKPGRGSPFI